MATDKIFDLEVFDVSSAGVCTADGGFVGSVTGNVTGDVTGNLTGIVGGTVSTYSTATPAIALIDRFVILDGSSNTCFATLADGTIEGQIMRFHCGSADNNCKISPATPAGFTSITFDAVNEVAELFWDGGLAWFIISTNGTVA